MTAVSSLTRNHVEVREGTGIAQDGYTTKFGFSYLDGAVITPITSAGSAYMFHGCTVLGGSATVVLKDKNGDAMAANVTLAWVAWGRK